MVGGTVNARREAVVRLRVRGSGGSEVEVDVVIDTGFSASLALPPTTVAALGLVPQSAARATLADGSVVQFSLFAAEVGWDGAWRPVLVSAVGSEPLVGMGLLARHELRIAVVPGGAVAIRPIP